MSAARPRVGRIKPRPKVEQAAPEVETKKAASSQVRTPVGRSRLGQRTNLPAATPLAVTAQKAAATAAVKPPAELKAEPPRQGSSVAPISIEATSDEAETDEDEEDDFEEVPIPHAGPSSPYPETPKTVATGGTVTPGEFGTPASVEEAYAEYGEGSEEEEEDDGVIRLEIGGETPEEKAKRIAMAMRKKPMTSKDRAIRIEAHKIHVIGLLANARIRNRWCSNSLLKARLLSLVPHPLVSAFAIPPSRFPDRAQRSRLFFDALQSLATWWSQSFFDIPDNTIGLRTRPWDEVQEIVDKLPKLDRTDLMASSASWAANKKGKDKADPWMAQLAEGSGGEHLRTVNSLMKKALQQEGSRDVSGLLFVSLCRACGLGTRLVVSLQAVPWRAEKVVAKKKTGAGTGGRTTASRQGNGNVTEDEDEDEFEEVPIPGDEEGGPVEVMGKLKARKNKDRAGGKRRLQDPADVYRLRKQKAPPAAAVGQSPKPKGKPKLGDLSQHPPVIWAEVFSRSDQRWIPVDPVRGTIRKKTHFEPASDNGPIRLTYVVAFEEDGYARDVTLRYTKSFGAKTAKLRPPKRSDEPDWWEGVLGFLTRPYRLNRDELEDAELETSQVSEAMPMHLNGFKDHPIYVLERHLKREEVLHPKREVGKFRGEAVYRRAHVQQCRTADNWMRVGRIVKQGQEPLKWVKQRAVTLEKRRQQELAKQDGEEILQGLYAQWQTELYRAPPIKDGLIPQNNFGNIDLYVPTMLPAGAVHLPYKGIAKVAKGLGISYAEACTGFEFKKRRAIPVITGIVVAVENETLVMQAYWESAAVQEEKERIKAEERALKRWGKLINGLRVRRRLQQEYGGQDLEQNQHNPLADADAAKEKEKERRGKATMDILRKAGDKGQQTWEEKVRDRTPEDTKPDIPESNREPNDSGENVPREEPTIQSENSEEDLEEVEVPSAALPSAAGASGTSKNGVKSKAHARGPAKNAPKPRTPGRRKRKLSPLSAEATSSDGSIARPPRKVAAARATATRTSTRNLRSSGSKTEEQLAAEEAKRERLREALAESD